MGALRRIGRRATTGLHRDDGGQTMAFVALTGFLICCFVILMLNNGRNLTHKVYCQNAVDASAVSAATWQARGMNLISFTNIMQSMLLAEAIFISAMPEAVFQSFEQADINATCFCDPWCDFDVGKCFQSVLEMLYSVIVEVQLAFEIWGLMDFVFDRMEDLSDVAALIQEGFQAMAMTDGTLMGQNNGLDYAFVWPNEMPLVEGEYRDLCDTMTNGNDGGYEAWWNTGVVSVMLYFSITEYPEIAFPPAFAAYQHWAMGPLGSPTQQLPFQMLFGEMAPLALGNTWWEMWVDVVYLAECQGGIGYIGFFTDTGRSVPLLLDEDYPESGKYLAIGYDDPGKGAAVLLPDHFQNGYNELFGTITVAQAEVVNTVDDSMFVPRWHARLSPVDKLDEMPFVIATYIYGTDGLPWPDAGAAGRISLWVATLKDLTQLMITH